MDRSRLEISPKVWLDHRRAIFLEEQSLLAVADLHLGYAWAQRFNGQLLPFGGGDRLHERLAELCGLYKPRSLAFLGDIIHEAVPVAEISDELCILLKSLSEQCEMKLIIGNHDRKLASLLAKRVDIQLRSSIRAGKYLLIHGDHSDHPIDNSVVIMGHEHPAISLGDGIRGAKFPCFLVSDALIVLPAFSLWSAGSDIRSHPFMSPLAQSAKFSRAVAVCGNKLLSISLKP